MRAASVHPPQQREFLTLTSLMGAGVLLLSGTALTACTSAPTPTPTVQHLTGQAAGEFVAECLKEKGWSADVGLDGGVSVSVPASQESQYEEASAACWSQIAAPSFDEMSPGELRDAFNVLLARRECMAGLGIDMPRPPTFATWVDSGEEWAPDLDVDMKTLMKYGSEITASCPSIP